MNDDKKKVFLWSIFGGLVIIALAFSVLRDMGIIFKKPPHIPYANSSELKANTVFLLDFSDSITDDVAKSIKSIISEHQNSIEVGGKLTLLRITSSLYESDAEIWKPENPSDSIRNKNWSCGSELYGIDTPRKEAAKKFCDFSDQMNKLIHKINEYAKGSIPSSPLIESISKISHRKDFTAEKRNIVLFSDLLQHYCRILIL